MSKTRKRIKRHKRKSRMKKGGLLMIKGTDLKNTHLCDVKPGKHKATPGKEVYVSIASSFQLNEDTTGYLMQNFKKSDNRWFKFVIFNNDGVEYIYIISGAPINKHSVCLLEGLLEVTKDKGEYQEIRQAYERLIGYKGLHGIEGDIENNMYVLELNQAINRDIPCMPVICAGSGTINEDKSICINTKSGHYKPNIEEMEYAKNIFERITKKKIEIIMKEDKEALIRKYGEYADEYSGICL